VLESCTAGLLVRYPGDVQQMRTCTDCRETKLERQYVDSHGQSEVAFGLTRLLGFQLLPRLKAIGVQKLYRPRLARPEPTHAWRPCSGDRSTGSSSRSSTTSSSSANRAADFD
jgi:hypothetical protein